MNLRKLYYTLSPDLRFKVRKLYYFPLDTYETIMGNREKYEPKKGDTFIGSGNFIQQGKHHLKLLKEYTDLKPSDCVLDVGCGIGRTAVSLTKYLNKEGKYEGFDVVKKGVDWCNSKIGKDFPNFNFKYIPLNNDLYNTESNKANDFKFPYADNMFDVVFLVSVFTHMQIDEINHYLSEIERVLKPNGKCLATFFLYNDENEYEVSSIKGFSFPVKMNDYRLMDSRVKSANVAVNESKLETMIKNNKLKKKFIIEGSWKRLTENYNESAYCDYQDIVVLEK
jgi:ubiquinone/menaquinone biosynthesis C-methylase UbiE